MHTVIHYEGFGRKKFCRVSLVNDFSCFFQYFRPKFDASLKFSKNTPKNWDEERKILKIYSVGHTKGFDK